MLLLFILEEMFPGVFGFRQQQPFTRMLSSGLSRLKETFWDTA